MVTVEFVLFILVLLVITIHSIIFWYAIRQMRKVPQVPDKSDIEESAITISVIIPAHNEEVDIKETVESVLQSTDRKDMEIIVVDDMSSDSTWDILTALKDADSTGRLKPIKGVRRDPNFGWKGKNWAVWQGSLKATGTYLLFIDADVVVRQAGIESIYNALKNQNVGWLSCSPGLNWSCVWERIVISYIMIIQRVGIPRINRGTKIYACGQVNIFDRKTYDQLGGHHAVGTITRESLALAERAKQMEIPTYMMLASHQFSVRWYRTFSEVWHGIRKSTISAVRGVGPVGTILGCIMLVVVRGLHWVLFAWKLVFLIQAAIVDITNMWTFDDSLLFCAAGIMIIMEGIFRGSAKYYISIDYSYWYLDLVGILIQCAIALSCICGPEEKWGVQTISTTEEKKNQPSLVQNESQVAIEIGKPGVDV